MCPPASMARRPWDGMAGARDRHEPAAHRMTRAWTSVVVIALRAWPVPTTTQAPVSIVLRRDVEVRAQAESGPQRRGVLYADVALHLRIGERLVMIAIGEEGGCRVRARELTLSSCPWLPGFRDHQSEIFQVVGKRRARAAQHRVAAGNGGAVAALLAPLAGCNLWHAVAAERWR